jgi:hypothetical protein
MVKGCFCNRPEARFVFLEGRFCYRPGKQPVGRGPHSHCAEGAKVRRVDDAAAAE